MSFELIRESTEEFLLGLLKRSYYFVLAGLVEPFDFMGRIVSFILDRQIILPPRLFIIFLGVGFVVAAIHTYHALRVEKLDVDRQYQIATSRRLELVFDISPPFEQATSITDSHSNRGTLRTFRVGVKNTGGTTISRAELELEHISPPTVVHCPVPLHIMHDNPPSGTPFRSDFSIDAGQVEFVDVAVKQEWPTLGGNPIHVAHTVSGIPADIPQGRYEFTLFAHGERASPARRTFVVEVDMNQRLVFRPL